MVIAGAPKLAPFNPSSAEVVARTGELARITEDDVVYDLGCGDGRLLASLASERRCRCVGIEYDPVYVERAKEEVEYRGVGDLVEVRHGDVCEVADIEHASVVFMYLSVKDNDKLRALVQQAFDSGARIVSNMFSLKYLGEPSESVVCDKITRLYLYEKPSEHDDEGDAGETEGESKSKPPPSGTKASGRNLQDEEGEEETLIQKLERWFDPLRNPLIIKIFNGAMAALTILLAVLVYLGLGNIHLYNIGALSLGLTVAVNWFLGELRKAVEAEKAEKEAAEARGELEADSDASETPKDPADKKSD